MSELIIWTNLVRSGMSKFGAAGMMGNLKAESALKSTNVEDRSGILDDMYTQQVDSGVRTKSQFAHDSYGYGLAQWTYYSRKEKLYDFAKSMGTSIGDETMQIAFLVRELKDDYPTVWNVLTSATSVQAASNAVLLQFERPANAQGQISYRANLGQNIYDTYKNVSVENYQGANPAAALASGFGVNVIDTASTLNPNGVILDGSGIETPIEIIYVNNGVATTASNINNQNTCLATMPDLKKGDKGIAVGMIQIALKYKGYALGFTGDNNDGVDFDFGSRLEAAVNSFKIGNNINNTGADYGVVNQAVWNAIWK